MDNYNARYYAQDSLRRQKLAAAAAAVLQPNRNHSGEIFRIIPLLSNADPLTREGAIKNLTKIGSRDAISYITRSLNDREPAVRIAACLGLGYLRAHPAKKNLYDALADRNYLVRCAAALALNDMGDKHGLPNIVELVCKNGPHQIEALRTLSRITCQKFPLTKSGLKEAIRWIKIRQKHLMNF